jgi:hypothetical protein
MSRNVQTADMLPRSSYSLFILNLPRLSGKERIKTVRNYLYTLYPGDLDTSRITIRKNGRRSASYLVFIYSPEIDTGIIPVPTLVTLAICRTEQERVIYAGDTWLEYVLCAAGGIEKSVVKRRDATALLADMAESFGDGTGPLTVICRNDDRTFFEPIVAFPYTFVSLENTLRRLSPERISLHVERSLTWRRRRVVRFVGVCALCAAVGFTYYWQYTARQAVVSRRVMEMEEAARVAAAETAAKNRLAVLETQYAAIKAEIRATPFEVLELIAASLDISTRIESVTIRDGFFQFEGISRDALAVLRTFETNRRIRNPAIQQVVPNGSDNRFTMSGTVLPRLPDVDTHASVTEQMAFLESAIVRYTAQAAAGSASALGVRIRDLLWKWNCRIQSYQYLSATAGWEIEFSVRAPSTQFIHFLDEASRSLPDYAFTLLQLRNQYPQNDLDALIRIKTTGRENEALFVPGDNAGEPADIHPELVEIAGYFYRAPRIRTVPVIVQELSVETPPVSEPPPADWLSYLGLIADAEGQQYIYIKDTRSGQMIRLAEGESDYRFTSNGTMEAYIDGAWYGVKR